MGDIRARGGARRPAGRTMRLALLSCVVGAIATLAPGGPLRSGATVQGHGPAPSVGDARRFVPRPPRSGDPHGPASNGLASAGQDQVIQFPPLPDPTYGDPDLDPGATASSGLPVSYAAEGQCEIAANRVHLVRIGLCVITASQVGDADFDPAPDVRRTISIARAPLAVRPAPFNPSRQYSDPNPPFSPEITGFVNGDGPAVMTSMPACETTATATSDPFHVYPIVCAGGAAGNYTLSYAQGALLVGPEDARVTYTGNTLFWTPSVTNTTALVTLSATIVDISAFPNDPAYDPHPGDISTATATFLDRDTGTTLCSAPVKLVDPADSMTGTVSCPTHLTAPSASGATQYTIGIIVRGNYGYGPFDRSEDAVIEVAQPLAANFITGAGSMNLTSSLAPPPGANGSRLQFAFNARYNVTGSGPQGTATIRFRTGTRLFEVKGTAITGLAVAKPAANFSTKATIRLINPAGTTLVDNNATLRVWLTDKGNPGTLDTLAIEVRLSGGTLWLSSHWNGTTSVEQAIATGNLHVL